MRRALALVWLLVSLSFVAAGQAYTTVTATNVTVDNGTGTAVNPPSGSSLCLLGVNNSGAPITYTPAGGSPVSGTVCQTLNGSGALTGTLQIANPATAAPLGLLYTITVVNGGTTYLTIPTVSLSGTVWSFDSYGLSSTGLALGIGKPHITCSGGAQWTSTTLPPGQTNALCNSAGSWQPYPPAPYCPTGQAYQVPQSGGMPFCLPPVTSTLGAPSGTCIHNATNIEQDNGAFWGCKAGAWVVLASSSPGVTSINGATGSFTLSGPGFGGCSTSGGMTTCAINGTTGLTSLNSLTGPALTLGSSDGSLGVVSSGTNINLTNLRYLFSLPNFSGLVGAFTDSGGNVVEPIWIGLGPVTFAVPPGATQLQMGINDAVNGDNTGSWTISVNGSNYTVLGSATPWLHTSGINSLYPTSISGATSPTVVNLSGAATATIAYVSGTVTNGGAGTFDAAGQRGAVDVASGQPGYYSLTAPSVSPNPMTSNGDLVVGGVSGYPTRLPASSGYLHWNGSSYVFDNPTGTGTVTSVGLSLPASLFSVAGSPVTSTGTLSASFVNQAANQFFAGPSTGAPATPAFRAIVPADLPLGSSSQAGALQCGSGTSCSGGVITASGGGGTSLISRVSCVTYGCVADGNVGANTGTDNTTPFTNCLTAAITAKAYCYVPAGVYRIATSLPTVNTSGTGFVGDIWSTSTSSGPSTTIFTSSASATILTISSGGLSFLTGNALIGISLQAGVTRNTGSIALLMDHAAEAYIHHNHFVDSAIGLDITNSPSYGIGMIEHNEADFGIVTACGAGPFIGFNLHGSSGGFTSLLIQSNNVYNNCGSTPTSYGYKGDGALVDLNMVNNFSDSTSYGVYMVGTSGLDVHIIDQTNDGNTVQCEHFDFGGSGALSELRGGYCDTHFGSSGGTELHNVVGMTVSGRQYYDPSGTLPQGILINTGSTGNSIVNNSFYQPNSIGVVCNGANKNTMSGNTFNLAGAASIAVQFTNCSNWAISGNTGLNGSSTVISLDSSSNNNKTVNVGNSWNSSGTAISDAGTGNQFASGGTTTNALTMNNSGSGAASGSTFDGSAAKTISYNTIGAAPAASPTFTGTVTIPVTGSTQCLQANSSGVISGTGSACGTGGGSGALTQIAQSVVSGSTTSSITFSSIPGTYSSLNIKCQGRFDDSATASVMGIRFNGDTGTNYDLVYNGNGALSDIGATGNSTYTGGISLAGATAGANIPTQANIDIINYAGTTFYKTVSTQWIRNSSTGNVNLAYIGGGDWRSTSAITSITLLDLGAGHFVAGSVCTLYGVQ